MPKQPEFATLTARGHSLRLGWKPVGYRAKPDAWITVHGHITAPEGDWRFRDASLEVQEARHLAAWLEDIAADRPAPPSLRFTEPCLTFEHSRPAPTTILLRTRFIGEVSPPWLWGDRDATWHDGYRLDLEVPPAELARFASELRRLVDR